MLHQLGSQARIVILYDPALPADGTDEWPIAWDTTVPEFVATDNADALASDLAAILDDLRACRTNRRSSPDTRTEQTSLRSSSVLERLY